MERGRRPKGANRVSSRDRSGHRCTPSPTGNGAGNRDSRSRSRSRSRCRSSSRSPRRRSTTAVSTTTTMVTSTTPNHTITTTVDTTTDTSTATSKPTTTGRHTGSPQNGRVVGGAFGGLVGGVAIAVIVFLLWRFFRAKKKRGTRLKEDAAENPHTYMGSINTTNPSSLVISTVPDVIMVSTAPIAPSQVEAEYHVIQEDENYQLATTKVSASNQADYTEISDTQESGLAQPAADYFVLEKDDHTRDDYNRLRNAGTPTEVEGTYNRLGDGIVSTPTDVKGTYNRLGDDIALTEEENTYNKLGDDTRGTPIEVKATYNVLGDDTGHRLM